MQIISHQFSRFINARKHDSITHCSPTLSPQRSKNALTAPTAMTALMACACIIDVAPFVDVGAGLVVVGVPEAAMVTPALLQML